MLGSNGKPLRGRKLKKELKRQEKERERALNDDLKRAKAEAKAADEEHKKAQVNKNQSVEARIRAEEKASKRASRDMARKLNRSKTVQKALGFEKLFEDGVCEIRPGLYSRTIAFEDVGYQTARGEAQKQIFNRYCELLNYLNEGIHLQLNLINNPITQQQFNEQIFLQPLNDGNDHLVREYNEMLASKSAQQTHTIDQQRYFTVTVQAPNKDKATALLANAVSDIQEQLHGIGSDSHALDGVERGTLLAELLLPGDEFDFDYEEAFFADITMKDAIAPSSFDFRPQGSDRFFKFGDKFGEVLFFKDLPSDISDRFLAGIMDLSLPLAVSIHFTAMDQAEAITLVRKKMAFMDQQRAAEAKAAVRQGLDPSFVSPELLHSMDEASDLLDHLRNRNQRLVFMSAMIFVWGDTYEELDNAIFQVTAEARKSSVKLASLDLRQKQGLNACLPIGCDYSDILRSMTTAEAAIFVPFSTSELSQRGGAYYGQNQVSNNLIILNRKTLKAPMGWVLGKPGGGKSFAVKREIFNTLITNPNDEVIVIDPMGEYGLFVEAIGGDVIRIDPESTTYLNPFDISSLYAGEGVNPIAFKSEFVMTMMDAILGSGAIGPIEHSIVDRVTKRLYVGMRDEWGPEDMPTLNDFYNELLAQPEPEAQRLARAIELYTKGTLDCFNHHTNVKENSRIRVFDTKALGGGLRVLGMLVVLDQVQNRASYNFERGIRTWLYIDEAQNFFENPNSINYFDKTYSEGRKKLIVPTAITQNVDRVIIHDKARQMFSNSDFMLLLSQSSNDLRHLANALQLSPKELDYVTNAKAGWGLLIAGAARIPFKDDFPKHTKLYELFSTDPNEREEKKRRERQEALIAQKQAERQDELEAKLAALAAEENAQRGDASEGDAGGNDATEGDAAILNADGLGGSAETQDEQPVVAGDRFEISEGIAHDRDEELNEEHAEEAGVQDDGEESAAEETTPTDEPEGTEEGQDEEPASTARVSLEELDDMALSELRAFALGAGVVGAMQKKRGAIVSELTEMGIAA